MRIWEMINEGQTDALQAHMQKLSANLDDRIRRGHTKLTGCTNWETWTEFNVPLMGGGVADITFDGCRKHSVACAK